MTIGDEYAPKVPRLNPSWNEAVETMVSFMKADNLRPGSIKQYEYVVSTLRKLFPETNGPAEITSGMARRFKVRRQVLDRPNPTAKKFNLHNFRGTAMSRARMAGVSYDDDAIAFGCNPQTTRQHYIALDEVEISDRVMEKIQSQT